MKSVNIGVDLALYNYMADNGTLNATIVRELLEYCDNNSHEIGQSPLGYLQSNRDRQTAIYRLRIDEELHRSLMSKRKALSFIDYTAYLLNNLYKEFEEVVING